MRAYLQFVRQWLRRSVQESRLVQGEATMESLRRCRIFAVIAPLVNLAYVAEFWWHTTDHASAERVRWANAIGWTHAVMAVAMVVVGLLIHRLYRRSTRSSAQAVMLQILFFACAVAFGIALSVSDQIVTTNTTNFSNICLLMGMLSLMRPVIALLVFGLAYFGFFYALALTQHNVDLLALTRSHALGAVVMSFTASVVMWHQFVAAVLLRREITRAHQDLSGKQAELEFLATHDALTGLHNRREFMRLAELEMVRAARFPADTCLIVVDLDFFKKINDQHGHPAGDAVLVQLASILKSGVREVDLVARLGGEEFIVLLPSTSIQGAMALAEKLRATVRAAVVHVQGTQIPVTASFGVSGLSRSQPGSVTALYAAADHALYAAKRGGRDRVEFAACATAAVVAEPDAVVR